MAITGGTSGVGGGATNLDSLTDVVIVAPFNGDILQYSGGQWINASYAHNSLSGLTVGDPHSQYLYLAGRAGGQTLLATAIGDNSLTIKAFAGQTGASLQFTNSINTLLASFVRETNSNGSDVFSIHMVSPAGQNSGAIHLWVAGVKGSGKFAQQYYNNSVDTYYTQIVNGTTGKIVFRNFSATGTPTFTLDPTDRGRFGINTESPGFTFDVWYNGASIFSVNNVGDTICRDIAGRNLSLSGSFKASALIVNVTSVDQLQITSDSISNFLDTVNTIKFRDAIGGGNTFAVLLKSGKLRLGDGTDPVHRLELIAGTATVAPRRVLAGVTLTVPVDGVEEYDGTNFYLSPAAVRQRVALMPMVRAIASFRI